VPDSEPETEIDDNVTVSVSTFEGVGTDELESVCVPEGVNELDSEKEELGEFDKDIESVQDSDDVDVSLSELLSEREGVSVNEGLTVVVPLWELLGDGVADSDDVNDTDCELFGEAL
jgi:hypothetical protein